VFVTGRLGLASEALQCVVAVPLLGFMLVPTLRARIKHIRNRFDIKVRWLSFWRI